MSGKVLLCGNTFDFLTPKIDLCFHTGEELRPEMLRWHIPETLKNVLYALLSLDGFVSAISANVGINWIHETRHPDRMFCRIFLGDICVAGFIHVAGKPYSDSQCREIAEWLWPETDKKTTETWTADQWREFFLGQIQENAEATLKNAEAKIAEGNVEKIVPESILRHIGKLPAKKRKPPYLFAVECIEAVYGTSMRDITWPPLREIGMAALDILKQSFVQGKIPEDGLSDVIKRLEKILYDPEAFDALGLLIKDFIKVMKQPPKI
jgi:hypothetical protein